MATMDEKRAFLEANKNKLLSCKMVSATIDFITSCVEWGHTREEVSSIVYKWTNGDFLKWQADGYPFIFPHNEDTTGIIHY